MFGRKSRHLTFRDTGVSRAIRIRILLLTAVFVVSTIGFYIFLNHTSHGRIGEMTSATLPTVSLSAAGHEMNTLHGYLHEMDLSYMRDSVTPLDSDRTLSLTVSCYDNKIKSASYEVRSTDTTRKIAESKFSDLSASDDKISLSAELPNLLEDNVEYLFILTLETSHTPIYYYTRVILPDNTHIADCIQFAQDFHDTSLSGDYSSLASYLETNYNIESDSLASVDITSTLDQVGWHGFDGSIASDLALDLEDIGDDYVGLSYDYQMQSGEGNDLTYYNVEEYFKIRYTADRMYLLDYSRTMDEILDPAHFIIEDNVLILGASHDMTYASNETGTIASFVSAGDLFEYNQNTATLTKIFSFRGEDVSDVRTNYDEHNIRILSMDENGTLNYVVYGYMNAGEHEGLCGINLYRYDPTTGQNTEQAFIISAKSYQVLHANFSDLIYMDASNNFYILSDGTLVRVNLQTLAITELLKGLRDTQYATASSGRYIAWIEGDYVDTTLQVMDLEDESTFTVSTSDDETLLHPVAYLQDNLVYARLHAADIVTDAAGATVYPAYELIIQESSKDGAILKTYAPEGSYITDIDATSFSLTMTLSSRTEEGYVANDTDTIQNTSGEENRSISLSEVADDDRQVVKALTLAASSEEEITSFDVDVAGLVIADSTRTIEITTTESVTHYYVYIGSHISLATTSVTDAIISADENMGIVVDTDQNYIWKRSRRAYVNAFTGLSVGSSDTDASTSAQALSAMLVRENENVEVNTLLAQGETPMSILSNTLKNKTVLDLTGCSLTEVLYFVNIGNPVYAKTGNDEAVLIVGYDAANAIIYDPAKDTTSKIGLNDGNTMFAAQGSVYISYLDAGEN